jgi:uncharacterized protein
MVRAWMFFLLLFLSLDINAAISSHPKIAIIIDDLGNRPYQDERVIHLPGPVVCSILPYTPLAIQLADQAHALHKEIMLHAPMQAIAPHYLGGGGLWLQENRLKFITTLTAELHAVPYIQGINNHMGSLVTQSPRDMNWVMQTIKPQHLFFIDSLTSGRSIAEHIAEIDGVPTARRDIFLDNIRTPEAVREQFQDLLWVARHKGSAIAIGHPYDVTLEVLEAELPRLAAEGYQLVPVSDLLIEPPPTRHVILAEHKSLVSGSKIANVGAGLVPALSWATTRAAPTINSLFSKLTTAEKFMTHSALHYKHLSQHEIKKWQNFAQGQQIANALRAQGLPVVTAISYNLEHEAFAVFPKIEGMVLTSAAASEQQAEKIGELLARIHTINLHLPPIKIAPAIWHQHLVGPDWHSYLAQAKQDTFFWTEILEQAVPDLKNWYAEYQLAEKIVTAKKQTVISHGDLVQNNVIWMEGNNPYIIDWDAAGSLHPQVELLGVATNWSGINTGEIQPKAFAAVLQGYRANGGVITLDKNIFNAHLGSWLAWLEFNIQQSLRKTKNTEDEIIHTINTLNLLVNLEDCLISYANSQ